MTRTIKEIFSAMSDMKVEDPYALKPAYTTAEMKDHSVLLYSGGLDSYLAAHFLKPDVCLTVNMRTQYSHKELEHMVPPPFGKWVFTNNLNLNEYEMPGSLIVPHRNALLVLLAAYYGSTIYLAAVANDLSTDKDQLFADYMTHLLQHIWQPSYWSEGTNMSVELPFVATTKEELIRRYVDTGGDTTTLLKTVSCYSPDIMQCGECKACMKRWVALTNCDLRDERFAKDPSELFTDEILQRVNTNTYRGKAEDERIRMALAKTKEFKV